MRMSDTQRTDAELSVITATVAHARRVERDLEELITRLRAELDKSRERTEKLEAMLPKSMRV